DSAGNPVAGSSVTLTVSNAAAAAGVLFADNDSRTYTSVTDASGVITGNVRSGSVPTPVLVNAVLGSNPAVNAASGGLAVNSGAPVQNFFSMSASSYNIEGAGYDGEIATITVFVADRLAQPVPDGTVISF